jgi:hypothetical protein
MWHNNGHYGRHKDWKEEQTFKYIRKISDLQSVQEQFTYERRIHRGT